MKLGILQTGEVDPDLVERFGEYPTMFEDLFWQVEPTLSFATWAVMDGELPESPQARDAWLITGSKHGVYDDLPWIEPLKDFLRQARTAGVPIIGVCFGHQILAEAFGGRAEKAADGWGLGVHSYEVVKRPGWMDAADHFRMHCMHQDQVTELPIDATVLARSDFNPRAMVAYGEIERPDAISIQPHPEFTSDYASALLDMRENVLPADRVATARESLGTQVTASAFVRWTLAYLNIRLKATQPAT